MLLAACPWPLDDEGQEIPRSTALSRAVAARLAALDRQDPRWIEAAEAVLQDTHSRTLAELRRKVESFADEVFGDGDEPFTFVVRATGRAPVLLAIYAETADPDPDPWPHDLVLALDILGVLAAPFSAEEFAGAGPTA